MRPPARVLVVDDDPTFSALALQLLRGAGYQVVAAGDAQSARAVLASSAVDLVVLDRFLPDMDALALAAQLGASAARPPIILVSASWRGLELPVADLDAVGIQLVVHKPIVPVRFTAQVAEVLARTAAAPPTPANVETTLQALRAEYAERLPARLLRLGALARQAFSRFDPDALAQARTEAHRLHGTAGSYGFPDIGELAGRLEDALEHAQAASPGEQEQLQRELAQAHDVLAASM